MASNTKESVSQILARLGRCLELIPIDPYGDEMSVGFYEKEGVKWMNMETVLICGNTYHEETSNETDNRDKQSD